jgi:hypothetical protein
VTNMLFNLMILSAGDTRKDILDALFGENDKDRNLKDIQKKFEIHVNSLKKTCKIGQIVYQMIINNNL